MKSSPKKENDMDSERIVQGMDWEKGHGKVAVVWQIADSDIGGRLLRFEILTQEELRSQMKGFKHGGVRWHFEIREALIDCDRDALLLRGTPFIDATDGVVGDVRLRIQEKDAHGMLIHGDECLHSCFYGHMYWENMQKRLLRDGEESLPQIVRENALFPVIVQEWVYGPVLMMAWMNKQSFIRTCETGTMCYWSRSRNTLWLKGETSGHTQNDPQFQFHCSGQRLLAYVKQKGAACHDGFRSCFYRRVTEGGLEVVGERLFDPKEVYKKAMPGLPSADTRGYHH